MLTISAQHSSQEFSKYLLDNMIKEVNLSVKNEDIEKSKLSIEFLEQKIKETDLSEIKEGLSDLVQKQIETIMIAESSPEYVFKTIDSAIVPERNNRNDYLKSQLRVLNNIWTPKLNVSEIKTTFVPPV